MFPSKHLLFGVIFSLILYLIFPQIGVTGLSLIILSTFLIDIDHYLYYILEKKDLSLQNAYNWFVKKFKFFRRISLKEREKYKREIMIFHGIEFWSLLFAMTFYNRIFLWIFIGVMFHIFLDYMALIYYKEPVYFKLSQTYTFIKNKRNKIEFK